ncbi:UDP-3-O-(3-hydroxymyristoyl)glucosamine N-acyltransferase, partial [Magnetococcales bacterium HHB-1]
GKVGIIPHTVVGQGARVASGSGVIEDVPAGSVVSGWWGVEHRKNVASILALRKLPDFIKRVKSFMEKHDG